MPISQLCADVNVGFVGPSSERRDPAGVPFLMGKNIGPGFLKLDSLERVDVAFHQAQRKSQLSPGDVVVVRIGESGQAARIPLELGEANCAGLVIIKEPRGIDPDFLVLYLNSAEGRNASRARSAGTTRQTLNTKTLASMRVPVPPLPIQRRIVDLMAHLDDHLANLRAEREVLAKGLDCARIELTAEWDHVPLAEICSIESRLVDPTKPPYSQMLHIGIERMGKDGGSLTELETAAAERLKSSKFLIAQNDVVFSKIRPNLRKVSVPGFEALCSADAYPLRPIEGLEPKLLREVLLHPLVTEAVVAKSGRTKMPKVNRRELFEVPVPMTEDVDARNRVGQVLETMRMILEGLTGEINSLARLHSALLPLLLDGDISIDSDYDFFLPQAS